MPTGTGALTSRNTPAEPFVVNPEMFASMTEKNEVSVGGSQIATVGTQLPPLQLPQTGIISRLQITFVGQIVVATAAATAGIRWPYGILDKFFLSANGETNLWNCDGLDLNVLRFARFPAYVERVDLFPGAVGGGSIAVGTYPLHITWEVPIAADDTTLVGALYAQSGSTNLSVDRWMASNAQLFSANAGNVSITGSFATTVTRFTVPRSPDAQGGNPLVIPDLTRLHGFNTAPTPLNSTGLVRAPLVRSAGQLHRLFISALATPAQRLSAMPNASASNAIDAVSFVYGNNQNPYNYNPAAGLVSRNNDWYGAPLPYDRVCMDFVRENAPRDIVLLQGITEAFLDLTVDPAVSPAGGEIRLLQETLF